MLESTTYIHGHENKQLTSHNSTTEPVTAWNSLSDDLRDPTL